MLAVLSKLSSLFFTVLKDNTDNQDNVSQGNRPYFVGLVVYVV